MNIHQHATSIAEYIARHPKRVLVLALLCSILGAWATVRLPVLTSRQALLPQDTEVAKRFNSFLNKFGAASDLIIVVEGAPRAELEAFADKLATQLRAEPEIGLATSHLDSAFFLRHAYLLVPKSFLDQLTHIGTTKFKQQGMESALQSALSWSQSNPALGTNDVDLATAETGLNLAHFILAEWQRWLTADTLPDSFDWQGLLADSGHKGITDGYFASRDDQMLFLFVRPKNPSGNFEHLGPFVDKVKLVSAQLAEQAKATGQHPPTVGLTGMPAIEYEEYLNIRQDIKLITITSAVVVLGLILLVVRSLRWAALIFIPIGLGILLGLSLTLAVIGHLTIITAAFIAILFGLGADYGIFTSSRIAEERRAGLPLVQAIGAGIGSSFHAVLTAGCASLLIFGTLATLDFPGFAELGKIATLGVLMILICTWTVQPALYALFPPKLKDTPGLDVPSPSKQVGRASPLPVAVALVTLAISFALFGAIKGSSIPFDYDVLSMLPSTSEAAHYQQRMVSESDYQAEVVIFTAKDMAEARRITDEANKLGSIAQTQSLAALFPEDADHRFQEAVNISQAFARSNFVKQLDRLDHEGLSAKSYELLTSILTNAATIVDDTQEQAFSAGHTQLLGALENVREQLLAIPALLAKDEAEGRQRSEHFLRALLSEARAGLAIIDGWQHNQPLTPEQLPTALHDRFFASDGTIAIYAFPVKSVYDPDNLDQLIKEAYSVSPEATGFPTTHQAFAKAVVESFTRGTLIALGLCLGWMLLATRNISRFLLASLPLLIGGGWMLGFMVLANIRYNYANIVALPLVIALAVDYGVWFSYRWHELKRQSPWQICRTAGKTIGLAAGTSLAGLGAITLASYRGVSSLGMGITIGLLCCLTATLAVAPAIGQLFDYKRKNDA